MRRYYALIKLTKVDIKYAKENYPQKRICKSLVPQHVADKVGKSLQGYIVVYPVHP